MVQVQYNSGFSSSISVFVREVDSQKAAWLLNRKELFYGVQDTSLGPCMVFLLDKAICALSLLMRKDESQVLEEFMRRWPGLIIRECRDVAKEALGRVFDIWEEGGDSKVELLLRGTPFQVRVWRALLTLPRGTTTSYQEIACSVGCPLAVRAVGQAVGRNPVALLVPCHRVCYKNGAVGGYHWGSECKKRLLAKEGASFV